MFGRLTNTLSRLHGLSMQVARQAGQPQGLASFGGSVADLRAFVAGAEPDYMDWIEANHLAPAVRELETEGHD